MIRPPRAVTAQQRRPAPYWVMACVAAFVIALHLNTLAETNAAAAASSESNQVARGREVYQASCARCHGQFLQGNGGIPRLGGPGSFVRSQFTNGQQLYDFISRAMPFDRPGSLTPDQYWDLVAFLWSYNGVDPGSMTVGPNTAERLTWNYTPAAAPAGAPAVSQSAGTSSGMRLLLAVSLAAVAVAGGAAAWIVNVRSRRRMKAGS